MKENKQNDTNVNETIKTILNHRSIRRYKQEKISESDIGLIIKSAQMAPSSVNGQNIAIIEVDNPITKKAIIEIASNQTWIEPASHFFVFCIDFYKAMYAADKQSLPNKMVGQTEAIIVGALDVGLAMGNAIVAAESMGYGVVPIGAIRNNPETMIDLLSLPEYVYPVAGFVVGIKDEESAIKPRFQVEAIWHKNGYRKNMGPMIDAYDEVMTDYMKQRTNGESNRSWSQTTATAFSIIRHPDITATLKKQGFGLK